MEAGKIKSSELRQRRNTVEEFFSPAVNRVESLATSCYYPLEPIASLAHVRGGKRLPSGTPYIENEGTLGIPYIRTCDIRPNSGIISLSDIVYIDESTHEIIRNYQLQQRDIVLSIAGTIGAVGILKEPLERCNFNENMAKIRVFNSEYLPEYVAAYLACGYGQAYIEWLKGGAVQAKLSLERINEIKIPKLPLPKQQQVVEVMDNAYAERRRLLEEADSVMEDSDRFVLNALGLLKSNILTSRRTKIRISELGGRHDQNYHNEELKSVISQVVGGAFPSKRLGEMITLIKYGASLKNDYVQEGVPFLRVTNLLPNDIELDEVLCLPDDSETLKLIGTSYVHENDLLMTRSGTVGIVARVPKEADGYAYGSYMIKFRLDGQYDPEYIAAILNNYIGRLQIDREKTGAVQMNINIAGIKSIVVPLPDDKIQKAIVAEVIRRRDKAKQLRLIAKSIIDAARREVEELIMDNNTARVTTFSN